MPHHKTPLSHPHCTPNRDIQHIDAHFGPGVPMGGHCSNQPGLSTNKQAGIASCTLASGLEGSYMPQLQHLFLQWHPCTQSYTRNEKESVPRALPTTPRRRRPANRPSQRLRFRTRERQGLRTCSSLLPRVHGAWCAACAVFGDVWLLVVRRGGRRLLSPP